MPKERFSRPPPRKENRELVRYSPKLPVRPAVYEGGLNGYYLIVYFMPIRVTRPFSNS